MSQSQTIAFVTHDGEMGQLILSKKWEATAAGSVAYWPRALQMAFQLILHSPLPTVLFWGPDYLQFYNDAFLQVLGDRKHPAALGNSARRTFAEAWDTIEPLLQRAGRGKAVRYADLPLMLEKQGAAENCYFDFSCSPVHDENGLVAGIMAVMIDVTAEVYARHRVEMAEERARLAVAASDLGTFDFDIPSGLAVTSERLHELFEAPKPCTTEQLTEKIHPDDRSVRLEAIDTAKKTGHLHYEVRINRLNGTIRWIRVNGKAVFDAEGKAYRLLGTVMDITDTKEHEAKREEYIAIASHELRNPLTSLKLSLDALSSFVTSKEALLLVNKGKMQYNRIMTLTDELLNVSKIAAGALDLKPGIFHLGEAINESVITFQSRVSRNPVEIKGTPDISIQGDRFRIEQVMVNLLSNASKYSPDGSPIVIDVEATREAVRIAVTDKGIGIDSDKIPHIFKKFSRLNTTDQVKGYGLGLYISEQIIRKHGGEIGLTSTKGSGSTFWFTIPL